MARCFSSSSPSSSIGGGGDGDGSSRKRALQYLKAAFLAMEPPNYFLSLARHIGGGSITNEVQISILELCGNNMCKGMGYNNIYVRRILKKVLTAAEATSEDILDGLYEQFAYHMSLHTEEIMPNERNKVYKQVSFLFPNGDDDHSDPRDLVVSLQCSINMLEGDTGCALWPSSLLLSEVILSHPDSFSNKTCFEVGSGVGLVGISLIHVGASKVVLSDGDESTLENMKYNLELNKLPTMTKALQGCHVDCKLLRWESPLGSELQSHLFDIILGADVIYDPLCVPHLIEVLSMLLSFDMKGDKFINHGEHQHNNILYSDVKRAPVAYIAQVIRNPETFDYFLKRAKESCLCIVDITETMSPQNLLPYMLSYDRSSVRLFKVSKESSCQC